MSGNLFCKDQKATTDKFRNGFDNIKWNGNNDIFFQYLSDIVDNIKDIEPEFSKTVDEDFWDLI